MDKEPDKGHLKWIAIGGAVALAIFYLVLSAISLNVRSSYKLASEVPAPWVMSVLPVFRIGSLLACIVAARYAMIVHKAEKNEHKKRRGRDD
jgi:hypothetical protein